MIPSHMSQGCQWQTTKNKLGRFLQKINLSQGLGVIWMVWALLSQQYISKEYGRIIQIRMLRLLRSNSNGCSMCSWHCWYWKRGVASGTAYTAYLRSHVSHYFIKNKALYVWNNGKPKEKQRYQLSFYSTLLNYLYQYFNV